MVQSAKELTFSAMNKPTTPLRTPSYYTSPIQRRKRERFKQRLEFIKHLSNQGFTADEIRDIFPEFPKLQITKIISKW